MEEAINSVLSQTYKDIEYIIVDGNSTDGTKEVINKYRDKISKFISEPDDGPYEAINKGIKLATGEVIGLLNSEPGREVQKRVASASSGTFYKKMGL